MVCGISGAIFQDHLCANHVALRNTTFNLQNKASIISLFNIGNTGQFPTRLYRNGYDPNVSAEVGVLRRVAELDLTGESFRRVEHQIAKWAEFHFTLPARKCDRRTCINRHAIHVGDQWRTVWNKIVIEYGNANALTGKGRSHIVNRDNRVVVVIQFNGQPNAKAGCIELLDAIFRCNFG